MSYPIQSYGRVEIRAQSDPAKNSDIFVLDITSEAGSVISQITPTPLPTQVSPNVLVNQGTVSDTTAMDEGAADRSLPGTLQWFIISIVVLGISYAIYLFTQRYFSLTGGTIIALYAVISGYACFLWFQLGLPGSFQRTNLLDLLYLILWELFCMVLGAGFGIGKQAKLLKKPSRSASKKADQEAKKK